MAWKATLYDDHATLRTLLRVRVVNGGHVSEVAPLVLVDIDEGLIPATQQPMMAGNPEDMKAFLQTMMDLAYTAGLRPSQAQDERHLKAHLEDMRRLAFRAFDPDGEDRK